MKLIIKDYCIRCGMCEDLYPQLFHLNHQRDAIDILHTPVPPELEDMARKAMADCAVTAIFAEQ